MSPGSLPPPALPGLRNLWAGGASQVAASCPGRQCRGGCCAAGALSWQHAVSEEQKCSLSSAAGWKCRWVCAWPGGECKQQHKVKAPGSCRTRAVSAGLCCKKPLARRLKRRFVVLLLHSGKKRSQVEHCPVELAWLLVPDVDHDPCQGFVTWICPQTQSCPSPARLGVSASRGM